MRRRQLALLFVSCILITFAARSAQATYSIAACDAKTRECGVAVQTNNLAVGASVPYAQAGVGALASQFETNPHYGPRGLALLSQGLSPEETLQRLLAEDGNFDGQGTEARQVGLVSVDGRSVNFTGAEAQHAAWAGARSGAGYTIQGNGLAGPNVLEAMEKAFLATQGSLADRLMAALIAGDSAGGQKTGRESAALLVKTPQGFPIDIDLRVDSSSDPVAGLHQLFDMQMARQQVVEAGMLAQKGQLDEAKALLIAAVARGSAWSRVWLRGAKVAVAIEEPSLALQYLSVAFAQNPKWIASEIGNGDYADLGADPRFHRWISSEDVTSALAAYSRFQQAREATLQQKIDLGALLLEVGRPAEALTVLNTLPQNSASPEVILLRSAAYAAGRDFSAAIAQCNAALASSPNPARLRRRIARYQQQLNAQGRSAESSQASQHKDSP